MINDKKIETINVGIVGHIDHGKTTLLYKLSGKWSSQHSEELKRGITIKLGYADITIYKDKSGYNIKSGEVIKYVSFIDAPGHEMLMHTMLSGAAIIDAAILVVAANEGIKTQTREHLMALQAKKVNNIIVVQNKIDLVGKEQANKSYMDIKELLKGKFANAPIIPVSAQQEINIDKILEAIVHLPSPERKVDGVPIFVVARSFDINKPGTTPDKLHGTVLGGGLKQGKLNIGDEIEIKPGLVVKEANQTHYKTIKTKVKKLFTGNKEEDELAPGGSQSIETELDMAIGKADHLAGSIVSLSEKLPELAYNLKVKYTLFPEMYMTTGMVKIDPIKTPENLLLSVNTAVTIGVVKKVGKNEVELSLKVPVVPFKGDNLGIARNINGHWRLIGYGEII